MTFLFDDEIIDALLKHAQSFAQDNIAPAKQIALTLAKNLQHFQNSKDQTPDADVYVRDLVSVDAFLNFLEKSKQRSSDGKLIAIHLVADNKEAEDELVKQGYYLYKKEGGTFAVYFDGLVWYLGMLDKFAYGDKTPNAQAMRPLIANLFQDFNVAFKDQLNGKQLSSVSDVKNKISINQEPENNSSKLQNVSYKGEEGSTGSNNGSNGSRLSPSSQKSLENALNNLPFNGLSPFNMNKFGTTISQIVAENPKLSDVDNMADIQHGAVELYQYYTDWMSAVSSIAQNFKPANDAIKHINNFDVNRPKTSLSYFFGDPINTHAMAQKLIAMITTTQLILAAIANSPDFTTIMSKSIISNQIKQADVYKSSLNSVSV